nr:hypothetical protein [Lachnospiraceae bacterium]
WVVDSFLKYKKYLNKDKENLIYIFTCIIILLITLASVLCLYASKYYYGERGYSVLVYILPFICIEVLTFMLTITTEKLRMPTIVLIVLFISFQIVIVPKIVSDFGLIGKYYETYTEKPQNVMKCEDIEKNALDIIGDKYSCEPKAIHSDGNVETSFILKYETYEMKIDYPDERVSVQFYVANSDNKYVIKKIVEKIYKEEKVVESDEIDAKFEKLVRTKKLIREKDYELDDGIKILFSPYEECWYEIKDGSFSYRYVFYNDNTVMFVDFDNYIEISSKMCNAIRDMFKQYN